jgi:hypothetical protein
MYPQYNNKNKNKLKMKKLNKKKSRLVVAQGWGIFEEMKNDLMGVGSCPPGNENVLKLVVGKAAQPCEFFKKSFNCMF